MSAARVNLQRPNIGVAVALSAMMLSACGGGGGSASPTSTSPPPPPPPPPPPVSGQVTISGDVTFESVPHRPAPNYSLDFDAAFDKAARGVLVEALSSSGSVLDTDVTDATGGYDVQVDQNTDVRIRVTAQLIETGLPSWDIRVVDNTNGFASYSMEGSLTSSGTANSIRDLSAPTGWNGSAFVGERAAGPFAILDGMYDAVQLILSAENTQQFEPLQIYWSVDNIPSDEVDVEAGELTSSFYTRFSGTPTIAILGDATSDADEFDTHVITHEFGHYVEDTISRSDSIGGAHSLFDRLDARVAFGEGFGNAFAGMALNDPTYRDDFGTGPNDAFGFSVDVNNFTGSLPRGWFNEASIQAILWDLFDASNDGVDVISGGFQPIYDVLSDGDYTNQPDFTTIYGFISDFRAGTSFDDQDIDALLTQQQIFGSGPQGTGESNSGGIGDTLPVYKSLTVGGPAVEVCSRDNNGVSVFGDPQTALGNKHGVRNYLALELPSGGSYTFRMDRTSGAGTRDPDFRVWNEGRIVAQGVSGVSNSEVATIGLSAGSYRIEAFDWCNTIGDDEGFGAGDSDFCNFDNTNWSDSCFSFSVSN
ncbi:MAG: hypothetical protein AAGJ84_07510 [Pseudomonadota bacterium]